MIHASRTAGLLAVVFLLSAGLAAADIFLTPFIGTTFGGSAKDDFGDSSHLVYGGTMTFKGDGLLGFEIDGQFSPDFFGEIGDSSVSSLMGALVLGGGSADSGLQFFVAGGGGLLKTRIEDRDDFFDINRSAFGITAGGSVIAMLSDSLGAKGDVRYFRGITDPEDDDEVDLDLTGFSFWRASVGLAIKF
jgi:hypothetical protein